MTDMPRPEGSNAVAEPDCELATEQALAVRSQSYTRLSVDPPNDFLLLEPQLGDWVQILSPKTISDDDLDEFIMSNASTFLAPGGGWGRSEAPVLRAMA